MNPYLAVVGLLLLTSTLIVLPLVPGLRELYRKSDASALSVIQQHTGEIRYFADSFRTYIKTLEPTLRECGITGRTATGTMPDGTEYIVLGTSDGTQIPAPTETNHPALIASTADLSLPSESIFSRDIYACGKLTGGASNQYRAVLAEKSVHLGEGSSVMRWVHAVAEFSADPGCRLYGRVSSDRSIRLQAGCSFLRLNAPRIETGQGNAAELHSPAAQAVAPTPSVNTPLRLLHDGDFEISAGQVFQGNLVVRGKLRIGAGARVYGSVKADQELVLDAGASVEGSLISARNLLIGPQCTVYGPIIAERKMLIQTGTQCGRAENPTTVSAPRIEIAEGAVVFGSLWAREQGEVVARS